jgi:RNA polymerase primary sigma factor
MNPDPYIAKFLNTIGKYQLLTFDQECELSKIIQAGRPAAIDYESGVLPPVSEWGCALAVKQLTHANLCLVVHNAKRYQSPDHTFFDFYQEGVFGLLDAVARYDGTKGYRFSTYATFYIRRSMSRLLCKGLISVPIGYHVSMQKRRRLYGAMCVELGRNPSETELMEKCVNDGVFESERSYKNNVQIIPRVVSGDTMLRDSEDYTIFDTVATECGDDELCAKAVKDAVNDALETLPLMTREVMMLNYGIKTERIPTRQIATLYDVEKKAIKTLKTKGMRQLRRPQTLTNLSKVR